MRVLYVCLCVKLSCSRVISAYTCLLCIAGALFKRFALFPAVFMQFFGLFIQNTAGKQHEFDAAVRRAQGQAGWDEVEHLVEGIGHRNNCSESL